MTRAEDTIRLPDGEELVVIDRLDWLAGAIGPDPRETTLDLRRQVSASVEVQHAPSTSAPSST